MNYNLFLDSIRTFESNPHYLNIMCLKEIKISKKSIIEDDYLKSVSILPNRNNLNYCCCLPKGHKDKCNKFYSIFINNPIIEKLNNSINTAIYSTPGNDDYVYKNRASRLYPHVLAKCEELKIKDTNIKKKCAIPLKDASSPILLAQAYLDYMTFIVNIREIEELLNKTHKEIFNLLEINKKY